MPSYVSSEPTTPKEMNVQPVVVVEERLQKYVKNDQERDKWLKVQPLIIYRSNIVLMYLRSSSRKTERSRKR